MLDRHVICLDGTERQLSEVEDGLADVLKQLERVERLLKVVMVRKEDLEARSCRNNSRISRVAETINMGRPNIFVKKRLTDLFAFEDTFAVKHTHRSLGPRPP
ncbi:hypothetical protein NDU88_003970, partial [Pleurodeles waltl]